MTATMPAPDYGLTGAAKERAFDAGLANAEWFQPVIDPGRLRELQARTDGRATFDTLLWIALLVGSGVWAYSTVWSWWSIPASWASSVSRSAICAIRNARRSTPARNRSSSRTCAASSRPSPSSRNAVFAAGPAPAPRLAKPCMP